MADQSTPDHKSWRVHDGKTWGSEIGQIAKECLFRAFLFCRGRHTPTLLGSVGHRVPRYISKGWSGGYPTRMGLLG